MHDQNIWVKCKNILAVIFAFQIFLNILSYIFKIIFEPRISISPGPLSMYDQNIKLKCKNKLAVIFAFQIILTLYFDHTWTVALEI